MLFISVGFVILFCQGLAEELEVFEWEGEDDAEFEEYGYGADSGAVELLRGSVREVGEQQALITLVNAVASGCC